MLRKRKRSCVDDGIFPVGVIVRTNSNSLQPQSFIKGMSARIGGTNFKRHLCCPQITRIARNVRQKLLRNTLPTIRWVRSNLQQLDLSIHDPTTRISNKMSVFWFNHSLGRILHFKCRPPGTICSWKFVKNLRGAPRVATHSACLQLFHCIYPHCF